MHTGHLQGGWSDPVFGLSFEVLTMTLLINVFTVSLIATCISAVVWFVHTELQSYRHDRFMRQWRDRLSPR